MNITKEQQDLVSRSYVNFKDKGILVLEGIHGKAFEGFKEVLTKKGVSIDREEVVFFKDLTWFGGGEEGVLITNQHLYYYQWGFKQIAVADILEIKIGGWFDENIVFVLKSGQAVSIWLSKLFSEIKAVVDILQSVDAVCEVKVKSVPVQIQCLGCKAIISSSQNFCEYCRSPIS